MASIWSRNSENVVRTPDSGESANERRNVQTLLLSGSSAVAITRFTVANYFRSSKRRKELYGVTAA